MQGMDIPAPEQAALPQIMLTLVHGQVRVQHNLTNQDADALLRMLTQMLAMATLGLNQAAPAEPKKRLLVATGCVPGFNGR